MTIAALQLAIDSPTGRFMEPRDTPEPVKLEKGSPAALALTFQALPAIAPGRYIFTLYVDGRKHSDASLRIEMSLAAE